MPTRERRKAKTWDEVKDDVLKSNDRIKGGKSTPKKNRGKQTAGNVDAAVQGETSPQVDSTEEKSHADKKAEKRRPAQAKVKVRRTQTGYQGNGLISTHTDFD